MMLKLALKNFFGAGLRTWLNILVLSIAFVAIIWLQGIFVSFSSRAFDAMIAEEIGGGYIQHKEYDPYDPTSLEETFAPLCEILLDIQNREKATAMLIYPAIAYPAGRMHNVTLRGIKPEQTILELPTEKMAADLGVVPVMIGSRMSRSTSLSEGDRFMIRWRDRRGALDAKEFEVAAVMSLENQSVDSGQIWMPLSDLQKMLQTDNAATIMVLSTEFDGQSVMGRIADDWILKTQYDLTEDLRSLIAMADIEYYVFYIIFLLLALISIFDTQILALFRRRKEMGTLMSLGMTRHQLIGLFTFEGGLYALFALLLGAVYGTPILIWTARNGFPLPEGMDMDSFGIPGITDTIYPDYRFSSIFSTIILSVIIVVIVSYLPARRIARLKPTDALRGKWS